MVCKQKVLIVDDEWAIRDVLIEKGKEMREMQKSSTPERDPAVRDSGPGIES